MNAWGERLIDIILALIIGIIALIAIFMIPSNEKIKGNEAQGYKSKKGFIFAAGGAALFMGVFIIIMYTTDSDNQNLLKILQLVFFMATGAALIGINVKKSKLVKTSEGMSVAVAAEAVTAEVMAQPIGVKAQTVPVQTAAAQQIGIKGQPAAQMQPQVAAQQIGIKQTAPVAAQPQPAVQAAPKPKVVVIKCPKCKGDMQISTAMLGQKIKCPHCGVEGKIG